MQLLLSLHFPRQGQSSLVLHCGSQRPSEAWVSLNMALKKLGIRVYTSNPISLKIKHEYLEFEVGLGYTGKPC